MICVHCVQILSLATHRTAAVNCLSSLSLSGSTHSSWWRRQRTRPSHSSVRLRMPSASGSSQSTWRCTAAILLDLYMSPTVANFILIISRDNFSPPHAKENGFDFMMHTFTIAQECDACARFLSGCFYQGYLCSGKRRMTRHTM